MFALQSFRLYGQITVLIAGEDVGQLAMLSWFCNNFFYIADVQMLMNGYLLLFLCAVIADTFMPKYLRSENQVRIISLSTMRNATG
ncbi:hypothetical protein Aduo_004604 [Ancylostoma duodenale]